MIQTKKSLGQHFLRSDRALADIAGAIPLHPSDTVLEIGPGEGVLTERLLRTGATVIAVEKDDRLITLLSDRFQKEAGEGRFRLIHGDVLDEIVLEKTHEALPEKWVLVANIPYYITGLILRTFLDDTRRPTDMVLLVQKEVAEDIVARDGKESIGSIAVKVYGEPRLIAKVPRGAFAPPPSVDSAILKISGIKEAFPSEDARRRFFEILRIGFKSRRKTVLNTLSDGTGREKEETRKILEALAIDPGSRPERLSVADWKRIGPAL